jgi:hypothetical protein
MKIKNELKIKMCENKKILRIPMEFIRNLPIEAWCRGIHSLHIRVQEFPSLLQHRQVPSAIPEPLLK